MSISHLSLVNQKLAYASSIIIALNTDSAELTAAQKLRQQALSDGAVFHLAMALHFYLRELAEYHRIKNLIAINSVQDLAVALLEADRTSSESSELLELVRTNDSWLSQLVAYYDQLSKSPEKPKEKKAFGQENLIELVELGGPENQPLLQLTPKLLSLWLDSFRALIMRQRETSVEY